MKKAKNIEKAPEKAEVDQDDLMSQKWNPKYNWRKEELGKHGLGAFISEPDYFTSIMNSILHDD